jgi:hypothetical protein
LTYIYNGMPASDLTTAHWYKSPASSPQGNCVELAGLPDEQIAMRNSRHPNGPALIFTKDQMKDLIDTLRSGTFDHLILDPNVRDQQTPTTRRTIPPGHPKAPGSPTTPASSARSDTEGLWVLPDPCGVEPAG